MESCVSNCGKKEYGLGLGPIPGMCAAQQVAVLLDLIAALLQASSLDIIRVKV